MPFLWGVLLESGDYREFETVAALVEWMCREENDGLILYAHNGGKFDYHFLRDHIEPDFPISVIAGRIARCRIGGVELRDSLNLFGQTKLSDFQKKEIDYRKMRKSERDKPEVRAEIRVYLRYDCEALLTLVKGFLDRFGAQFTQAGAAMKYWQKHHAPDHEVPHSSRAFYDQFHPFYFGGRVQCFASGHAFEPFSVIDINSAYPFAMLSRHAYSTQPPLVLSTLPRDDSLIPQCLVELDAISKGGFPLRSDDNSLYFPNDERTVRRYKITGWELQVALETDTVQIVRIVAVYLFSKAVSFNDYVQHFFEMRKAAKLVGDKAQDIFAKIFLNALYGKFCSNPRKYQEFMLSDSESETYKHWIASGYFNAGPWGGRSMLVRPLPESKHRYYNIVTGASITGYVRAHLWRALQKVSRPLYCDTDSIAARDVSAVDLGSELGQWKHEAYCDEYAIGGKKNYAFHIVGKDREASFDCTRQKPLSREESPGEWKELRSAWKMASKGADLSPRQMIEVAEGKRVLYENPVPNFSIHLPMPGQYEGRKDRSFVNRVVSSTYRDISRYEAA